MTIDEAATRRPERGPSMADVARQAGVSSQTVSRVAHDSPNVEDDTRQRVLDAMKELGYRPNRAARALRSGRFGSIGVITFTLSTFGNMRTLEAIADHAGRADYSVSLLPVSSATRDGVSGALTRLSEQAVDGVIIIFEARLLDHSALSLPDGLPVVVIDSTLGGPSQYPNVDTDQVMGATQATEHLLDLGHPTVWHISGPQSSFSATHRREAWANVLRDRGATVPPPLEGDWSTDSGYAAGLRLAERDDVSAVFAANDQMALGAIRAFHERGRDVPGEISVVGFDDLEESSSFWPPLTTVKQDFAEVGRLALDMLLHRVDGSGDGARTALVSTELIVRQSTAEFRPRVATL